MKGLSVSSGRVEHRYRAKYYYGDEGLCLYQVQGFGKPVFREVGYEAQEVIIAGKEKEKGAGDARARAARRARRLAFDLVICNPGLNAFFTLTYAPKEGFDRTAYEDVYEPLRAFLSNRVQRRGLRYIMTAERHKAGGIHFHGLCNAEALRLVEAHNPHTGAPIVDRGKPVFNISDWGGIGFSTCKLLGVEKDDRSRVARYVTKYITKDGDMVGGRYIYHGGALARPVCVLGDSLEELANGRTPFKCYKALVDGLGEYEEYSFL